jgi:hypothetical protein
MTRRPPQELTLRGSIGLNHLADLETGLDRRKPRRSAKEEPAAGRNGRRETQEGPPPSRRRL